jgi:hypothetical protein
MAREIPSKRNFLDFELPDSAISRFPMTLMKSMASLHQGSIYLFLNKLTFTDKLKRFTKSLFKDVLTTSYLRHKMTLSLKFNRHNQTVLQKLFIVW